MAEVHHIHRSSWANPTVEADVWRGLFQGGALGANISLVFTSTPLIGEGPRLHQHPYTETFIVRAGNMRFTIGDRVIDAVAGDILVAPPNTPHKFLNLGPGPMESIDIHEAGAFETVWLE